LLPEKGNDSYCGFTPMEETPAEVWAVIGVGNPLSADALALYRQTRPTHEVCDTKLEQS
jgi:hypothetical protein